MRLHLRTISALAAGLALLGSLLLLPGPEPAHASGVVAISAGSEHTCALTAEGGVRCWGKNVWGQVGDGTGADRRSTPVDVLDAPGGPPLTDISAVSAGGVHTCALSRGGAVQCWGSNFFGQLGDRTRLGRFTPVDVVGLTGGVAAIAAGGLHTCALMTEGAVKCWGRNEYGQLGDGTSGDGDPLTQDNNSTAPVNVCQDYDESSQQCLEDLSGAVSVTAGGNYTCAVMGGGGVKCWGINLSGELGDGTGGRDRLTDPVPFQATPVDVCQDYDADAAQCNEVLAATAQVAPGLTHSCAVSETGLVKCWGTNSAGQLGDGGVCGTFPFFTCTTPVDAVELTDEAAAVTLGTVHTCAVIVTGRVKCWGQNGDGQIGDRQRCGFVCLTPVEVCTNMGCTAILSGVADVSSGDFHTCALTAAGAVKCWGENFWGQLGSSLCCDNRTSADDVEGLGPKPTPAPSATVTREATPAATDSATPATPEGTAAAATLTPLAADPSETPALTLPQTGSAAGPGTDAPLRWPVVALAAAGGAAIGLAWLQRRAKEVRS